MPEGPEIKINSLFINHVCNGKVFSGKPVRSDVAKSPEIEFDDKNYTINSTSRGKELALTLQSKTVSSKKLRILFRFGMSGKFMLTPEDELPKHAHLQFYSQDSNPRTKKVQLVLSFVDARRFGSWHITDEWGANRGPDVVYQHREFRENILSNLDDAVFNKSICEVLLNQKFFNGIGNYLRAEILYRAKIPPFTCARDVLENSSESCTSDILQLCHDVPLEVIQMKQDVGKVLDTALREQYYKKFLEWLQCYDQQGMMSVKDHNGRTIWYKGAAGPLAPKQGSACKSRKRKLEQQKVKDSVKKEESEVLSPPLKMSKASIKEIPSTQAIRRSARLLEHCVRTLINFKMSDTQEKEKKFSQIEADHTEGPSGNHLLRLIKLKEQNEEIQSTLESKKREFAERMETCAMKKVQLKKRRDELDKHVSKFQPILQESQLRRIKAIRIASAETHEVSQNEQQISILASELKILNKRRLRLTECVDSLAKVTTFIERVCSDFPQDYIDDENMSTSAAVVVRYQTLLDANKYIKDKVQQDLDEVTKLQQDRIELHKKHESRVMMLTSEISELRRKLDRLVANNQSNEEKVQRAIKTYQYKEQITHWGLVAEHAFQQIIKDKESVSSSFAAMDGQNC